MGHRTLWASLLLIAFSADWLIAAEPVPNHMTLWLDKGVYYPDAYYSRAYVQPFPIRPNQRIMYFRLKPEEHYGRYRLGVPFPNMTNGQVDPYPFQYIYGTPVPPPPPVPPVLECDPPPELNPIGQRGGNSRR